MLTGQVDHIIGVDTHRDHHTLAVVDPNGGAHATTQIATDAFGYRRMLAFARAQAPGRRVWAIEGTGSFGAGLTCHLLENDEWVVEIDRPKRPARRNGAKTDELDAVRAGREALAREHLAQPRRRGDREAIRVLLTTRQGTVVARTKAICQLKALLVGAPEQLRQHFRGMTTDQQLERCARLRTVPSHSAEHRATVRALRISARQALFLEAQAADLETELEELVLDAAPTLLDQPGVGVVSAAQIIISWSHPGRLRSEAAFASLAGAAPIPASSGQITRHRLNRSGDRQLNRALHTIVLSRLQHHAPTRAYAARRTAEGKTAREIKRCLKRAVARQLFRLLESAARPQNAEGPPPGSETQPEVSAASGSNPPSPAGAGHSSPDLDPALPHDQDAHQRGRPPLSTPQAPDLENHVPRGLMRDLPRPTLTT
ncbi:IS110 family transposase [Streptomyces canus]|uniref:IS110 family transposase n=1 Tax=Streptomyces canus TaxID=58343 RepID=UPI0036D11AB2